MKVNWIIENIVKEESFLALEKAVDRAGYPLQTIKGDFKKSDIENYNNECVIFNGSIEMAKMISAQLTLQNCSPIIYCNWDAYKCSSYYPHFSDFIFNDNYVMVPLLELKKRIYQFYGIFGREGMIFVRPDDGDKSFKAGIIALEDFDRFYEDIESCANDLVLISTPKTIIGEWRFVCTRHKEILTVSSYRYQGAIVRIPSAPTGATKFVEKVLDVGYYPDSVFCVDVAQDSAGDFWLMELTSFSSAGLYAANKDSIVKRVSEIAWEDFNKHNEQRIK